MWWKFYDCFCLTMVLISFTIPYYFLSFIHTNHIIVQNADYFTRWGDDKDLGKEGLSGDFFRWCRPICMQLRLLPFPSVCRAEWYKIALCSCAALLNHWRRDPNAICSFLVGGTCFSLLVELLVTHPHLNVQELFWFVYWNWPCV